MTLADKIVVLKDGEVMQVYAPMDLFNYPENKFVAGFLISKDEFFRMQAGFGKWCKNTRQSGI